VENLNQQHRLIWDPNGNETLIDYRKRVDKIIEGVTGQKRPVGKTRRRLVADFNRWRTGGEKLLKVLIGDEIIHGMLQVADLEKLESQLRGLREVIEQSA